MATIVFKDLHKLVSQQQQDNIRKELFQRLKDKPFWIWDKEQHKLEGIRTATAITKEAWNTADQTGDKRERIHALSLTKECYHLF